MSILVKGIQMPESCKTCLFRRECQNPWGFWTNHCGLYTWCGITPDKIPGECRLVEVKTPHGRLIYADALLAMDDGYYSQFGYSPPDIDEMPTIVKAEGWGAE